MLIDGDGETFLGFVLADYILVKKKFDLARLWQRRPTGNGLGLLIVRDDLVADVDALVADVNRRAGNELLHFVLRFPAKRTTQSIVSSSYHTVGRLLKRSSIYSDYFGLTAEGFANSGAIIN